MFRFLWDVVSILFSRFSNLATAVFPLFDCKFLISREHFRKLSPQQATMSSWKCSKNKPVFQFYFGVVCTIKLGFSRNWLIFLFVLAAGQLPFYYPNVDLFSRNVILSFQKFYFNSSCFGSGTWSKMARKNILQMGLDWLFLVARSTWLARLFSVE